MDKMFEFITFNKNRISASIKSCAEDFIVQEIDQNNNLLKIQDWGSATKIIKPKDEFFKYTHFCLQKKNWNTQSALMEIAKQLHISYKRFSFAGTKDKKAITTQMISIKNLEPIELLKIHIKDLQINFIEKKQYSLGLGDLWGNNFKIKLNFEDQTKTLETALNNLKNNNYTFPNYFGMQRFGQRKNNHLIGKLILQSKFQQAVEQILYSTSEYEPDKYTQARKQLEQNQDFKKALSYFPNSLRIEKKIISRLSKNPTDYLSALKAIPRNILLLFINAYSSYLFNQSLTLWLKSQEQKDHIPKNLVFNIIGYQTKEYDINQWERQILEKENVTKAIFKNREFNEISQKGAKRNAIETMYNFSYKDKWISFDLTSSSYATVAINELIQLY